MPCGVPIQTWPYSCQIGLNNGIRFDPNLGALWAPPPEQRLAFSDSATLISNSTLGHAAVSADGTWLRVWWHGAAYNYGARAQFNLSTEMTISHTNTTCVPQRVSAWVRTPSFRWQASPQVAGANVGVQGAVNGVDQNATVWSPNDGFNAQTIAPSGTAGYPWSAGVPRTLIGLSSLVGPVYAAPTAMTFPTYPKVSVDVFNGQRTVNPGATVSFSYKIIGTTQHAPSPLQSGGGPDDPYLAGWCDVSDAGRLFLLVN